MYANELYDIDKYIYRFTSLDRALETIGNGELTLVRSKLWDDPFENFLFRQEFKTINGDILNLSDFTREVYGQCWTIRRESDFAWRVYTSGGFGARIKIKVSELHNHLAKQVTDVNAAIIFGKVEYMPWKKIKEKYEDREQIYAPLFSGIKKRADMFFKRSEFKHESEYRILYRNPKLAKSKDDLVKFKIDPNEIIEHIMLDPRMTKDQYKSYRSLFQKLGYKGKIGLSKLYQIPEMDILIDINTSNYITEDSNR